MFDNISDKWAVQVLKGRYDTALLEILFGSMLRESNSVSVFRTKNGDEIYIFVFTDGTTLNVTLDREAICTDVIGTYTEEQE